MMTTAMFVQRILKNRFFQLILAFVVGGLVTTFILPEKIVIKKETQVEYVDRVIEKEVVKWKERVVEKEKIVYSSEKKIKRKETWPNGHIIEEEIYESNTEQIERVSEEEKEKYEMQLAQKEKEFKEKISSLKVHTNPKKINLYAGIGTYMDDFSKKYFLGGFSYVLWGPMSIGGEVTTEKQVGITVGVRF